MRPLEWSDQVIGWTAPVLLLTMASGPLILAYQCFQWLKTGAWTPLPISAVFGLSANSIEWGGARQIVNFLLDTPLALFVFVAPLLMLALVTSTIDYLQSNLRRQGKS